MSKKVLVALVAFLGAAIAVGVLFWLHPSHTPRPALICASVVGFALCAFIFCTQNEIEGGCVFLMLSILCVILFPVVMAKAFRPNRWIAYAAEIHLVVALVSGQIIRALVRRE